MYLHVGRDEMIPNRSIIAILSRTLLKESEELRHLFHRMRGEGKVSGDIEEAKTLVLTDSQIVLSNISSQTLLKRSERLEEPFE